MEFFKTNTKIPFMKQRTIAFIFSAIIFIGSIAALATQSLQLGLDFTGGTQMDVTFSQVVTSYNLSDKLRDAGFKQAEVKQYNNHDVSITVGIYKQLSQEQLKQKLLAALPGKPTTGQLQYIGPQVGKQLLTNGILAVLVCLLGTMTYIALRFDYRFALSAALALIHDPMLILGIFSAFHIEFNMIALTALLTVIGYSLNDTIVVYDRVRENFRKIRKGTPYEIMDRSINDTLSRTIMSSGLTLLVVIALFVYGGDMIHGFALALIIGIVVGTYSSIYIAGALAVMFGLDRKSLIVKAKTYDDGTP